MVIWFTGMSGSGKTTLSMDLSRYFKKKNGNILLLDGDKIRSTIHTDLDYSPKGIKRNSLLIIDYCKEQLSFYDHIIVSVIAPFEETRSQARAILRENYIEIYVQASIDNLIKRDTKGLYKKAFRGELDNLIGVSDKNPYQIPEYPDLIVNTDNQTQIESLNLILNFLSSKGN